MTAEELTEIQRTIYEQTGIRTDIYYEYGRGVIAVPEGAALIPQNVIAAIPDVQRSTFTVTFGR
jgi:hypothetical protein